MIVTLIARAKVGHIELRKANRSDHIDYLNSGMALPRAVHCCQVSVR